MGDIQKTLRVLRHLPDLREHMLSEIRFQRMVLVAKLHRLS